MQANIHIVSTQISSTTTLSDEKAEEIIKESDVNGNGEICFEEFMKLFFLLEES